MAKRIKTLPAMGTDLARKALERFIDAIDATGGVTTDDKGYTVPVADEDWIDLGEAYLLACEAFGRKPKEG